MPPYMPPCHYDFDLKYRPNRREAAWYAGAVNTASNHRKSCPWLFRPYHCRCRWPDMQPTHEATHFAWKYRFIRLQCPHCTWKKKRFAHADFSCDSPAQSRKFKFSLVVDIPRPYIFGLNCFYICPQTLARALNSGDVIIDVTRRIKAFAFITYGRLSCKLVVVVAICAVKNESIMGIIDEKWWNWQKLTWLLWLFI